MAIFGDDQGRTEKPTPQRLGEVRNRGDTHLSRELLTGGVLLATAILLRCLGGWLVGSLADTMRAGLDVDLAEHAIARGDVSGACTEIVSMVLLFGTPLLVLMALLLLVTLVLGYGQIGLRFATEVVQLKLDRLNPAANVKRVFNLQALVRTGFAMLKLLVLALVLWLVLRGRWSQLAMLPYHELDVSVGIVTDIAFTVLLWVAAVVFVLALADVFWQRFDFERRNMMTKQEVEDERKRAEGDPMVKNRLRQARAELLRHRMMQAVPKADVVITNPTHFAVALRYDRRRNAAPEVVAKGADELALRIRELAKEHDVPLLEDPPLARALFRAVKVGQEVPAKFYQAVATVLSHVYRIKQRGVA